MVLRVGPPGHGRRSPRRSRKPSSWMSQRHPKDSKVAALRCVQRDGGRGPASPISSIWDSWRVRPPMRANRQIFSGVSIGNGNYDVAQIAAIMSRSAIVGDAVEHRSAKVGTKEYCWRHRDPPGAWPSRADGRLARCGKLATRCRAPRCPSIAGGTAVLLPSMVYSRSE